MFFYTDTADAPWTIIKSDDKKRARLNCMLHFLSHAGLSGQGPARIAHAPDPLIVGQAGHVIHRSLAYPRRVAASRDAAREVDASVPRVVPAGAFPKGRRFGPRGIRAPKTTKIKYVNTRTSSRGKYGADIPSAL
jgi:hypothetical protein